MKVDLLFWDNFKIYDKNIFSIALWAFQFINCSVIWKHRHLRRNVATLLTWIYQYLRWELKLKLWRCIWTLMKLCHFCSKQNDRESWASVLGRRKEVYLNVLVFVLGRLIFKLLEMASTKEAGRTLHFSHRWLCDASVNCADSIFSG